MNKGSNIMPRANVFRIHNPNCPNCGTICHEAISFDKEGKPDPDDWVTLHWWRCRFCGYQRERPANPRLDPTVTITKIQ